MTDKLIATLNKAGVRNISTDLWGIFYEDISYSGDGGLNADLVQNGAFEYNRADSSGGRRKPALCVRRSRTGAGFA